MASAALQPPTAWSAGKRLPFCLASSLALSLPVHHTESWCNDLHCPKSLWSRATSAAFWNEMPLAPARLLFNQVEIPIGHRIASRTVPGSALDAADQQGAFQPLRMSSLSQRSKDLFRKYGKIALGVHLTVYAGFFAGEGQTQAASRMPTCRTALGPVWTGGSGASGLGRCAAAVAAAGYEGSPPCCSCLHANFCRVLCGH